MFETKIHMSYVRSTINYSKNTYSFCYRTELFRQFKLCKLLLRPLEDRLSATNRGGSSKIRGYSRQTEDYASSLSNSGDNSAQQDFEHDGQGWEPTYRPSALYRYPRPGSRAFSLPSRVGLGRVLSLIGLCPRSC